MERAEALRAESDRLVDKNRVQQAELERLKQAEAQRVASERPAVVADAIVTVGKAIDTRVVEAELANSALRFPSAATRDMVDVDDHRTRLRAMVEPDQETWDLSPNDTAAIQWALDRIAELEASA